MDIIDKLVYAENAGKRLYRITTVMCVAAAQGLFCIAREKQKPRYNKQGFASTDYIFGKIIVS